MYKYVNGELSEQFVNNDFLINCGTEKNLNYKFEFIFEPNIKKAIKSITAKKWKNFSFEKYQDISSYMVINHREKGPDINDLVGEAREIVVPKISKKFENEHHNEEYCEHFLNDIKYQIITCLVADGHREFLKSELHEQMIEIYLSGHIPCGIEGNMKKWKIIVH